jgi:hypothetical protein
MLAPIEEIFCDLDDFCKEIERQGKTRFLSNPDRKRNRSGQMSPSEVMTIMILFHLSHYRTFKDFYYEAKNELLRYFPRLLSYNRLVEIQGSILSFLGAYLLSKAGAKTGFYYVDSTSLAVCHVRRIYRHRVFRGLAERGKTSMGWFFGFKLHLVINHMGEIVSFCFTKGNVDDRKPLEQLFQGLQGLGVGDKGYLSKTKSETLSQQGLRFITKLRKNMKKKVLSAFEKFFLSRRNIVETVIDQLKALCQISHTRHRNATNFFVNAIAGLAAYMLRPRKPRINLPKLSVSSYALIPS